MKYCFLQCSTTHSLPHTIHSSHSSPAEEKYQLWWLLFLIVFQFYLFCCFVVAVLVKWALLLKLILLMLTVTLGVFHNPLLSDVSYFTPLLDMQILDYYRSSAGTYLTSCSLLNALSLLPALAVPEELWTEKGQRKSLAEPPREHRVMFHLDRTLCSQCYASIKISPSADLLTQLP